MFIVFEGIDGVGKSTQAKLLADKLSDEYDVVLTKEPGATELGRTIREELFFRTTTKNMAPNVADCLLLADHMQHVHEVVRPALDRGAIVISDRFVYSQIAYSSVRDVDHSINELFLKYKGATPDMMFFLSDDPDICLARAKGRNDGKQDGKVWNDSRLMARIQESYKGIWQLLVDDAAIHRNEMLPYYWLSINRMGSITPEKIQEDYILPRVQREIGWRLHNNFLKKKC